MIGMLLAAEPVSAPVTQWPMRILLVLLVLRAVVACAVRPTSCCSFSQLLDQFSHKTRECYNRTPAALT
jgi:hypothetical protein